MGKRKRATEDPGLASQGTAKKFKGQEQERNNTGVEGSGALHAGEDRTKFDEPAQPQNSTKINTNESKLAKRERRRLRKEQEAAFWAEEKEEKPSQTSEANGISPSDSRISKSRKKKDAQKRNVQQSKDSAWKLTNPVGGRLLDCDPIFSHDENHFFLAYESVISVYSTETSLPVRSLRINRKISAFAISSLQETQLYVSTISGTIEKWDWTQGFRTGHWKLSSSIHALSTSVQTPGEAARDIVYTIDRKGSGPWLISAHVLAHGEASSKTEVKTLFTSSKALTSVKTLESGRYIIATSGAQMIIGVSNMPSPVRLQDLAYTWRTVECPEWIVSCDVRVLLQDKDRRYSKRGKERADCLDIAVGGLRGSIHVYENMLGNLILKEQQKGKEGSDSIKSRRLHWHRNAVLSLKWSLDGNYLISGGEETVLVLWQLETGRKQDIPHLGAPIESIVVSPTGASYGVRLADNSAMILSTSELRPTFSIAGLQIPIARSNKGTEVPFIPIVNAPVPRRGPDPPPFIPACTSSTHPGTLLLAVPPLNRSRLLTTIPQSRSYLQTFDLSAGHQIHRQALTRTRVTDLNMGPESNFIEEPNVTHIQTSADGHWLATVEEWMPPKRDLVSLAFDEEQLAEERRCRLEIYLKLWSLNNESKAWELVSRIDAPHASQSGNSYGRGNVLGLSSDPHSTGFATVGADETLKTWKPAIRRRQGLNVRDKDGRSLTSWHCKHIVSLESIDITVKTSHQSAKLAYSQDGSILIAAFQMQEASPIYVVDTINGALQSVQTGFYEGPLLGLSIIDKYLITLSSELRVFDLVTEELNYGIQLNTYGLSSEKQIAVSHLAVDIRQGLFAVALPKITHSEEKPTELQSQFAIFDPKHAAPLFRKSIPNTITILLSTGERRGFIAIDSAAEIRQILPSQSLPSLLSAASNDNKAPPRQLRDMFKTEGEVRTSNNAASARIGLLKPGHSSIVHKTRIPEDDTVVVSQDRLAEVFDVGPAYALPPVTNLFEQVASLYSGRVAS